MNSWILLVGSLASGLAVLMGAFGAHALSDILDDRAQGWYDTAVTYHATHALALVACGITALLAGATQTTCRSSSDKSALWLRSAAICFILGIVIFSGSLYATLG